VEFVGYEEVDVTAEFHHGFSWMGDCAPIAEFNIVVDEQPG
jgi:hypothetical protein